MYVRRSARVALLDAEDRVLLLHSRFRRTVPGTELAWFLPGGGVEDGEGLRPAAVREVAEETGIDVAEASLVHLLFSEGNGTVGDLTGPMRDDVFVTTVPSTGVSRAGLEDHERRAIARYRWWSIPDLCRTADPVFPLGLGSALDDFSRADRWPSPRRLPW